MDNARILVIGAGVNGSVCASGLYSAGVGVTVLARGTRYEELREEGIVIEDPFNHKRRVTKVPVINCLDPDDLYDYVLVVIRKNQAADLLPVLAQNRSPNIVFMGNNLSGPDEFTRILGKDRVMVGADFGKDGLFAGHRRMRPAPPLESSKQGHGLHLQETFWSAIQIQSARCSAERRVD